MTKMRQSVLKTFEDSPRVRCGVVEAFLGYRPPSKMSRVNSQLVLQQLQRLVSLTFHLFWFCNSSACEVTCCCCCWSWCRIWCQCNAKVHFQLEIQLSDCCCFTCSVLSGFSAAELIPNQWLMDGWLCL